MGTKIKFNVKPKNQLTSKIFSSFFLFDYMQSISYNSNPFLNILRMDINFNHELSL